METRKHFLEPGRNHNVAVYNVRTLASCTGRPVRTLMSTLAPLELDKQSHIKASVLSC